MRVTERQTQGQGDGESPIPETMKHGVPLMPHARQRQSPSHLLTGLLLAGPKRCLASMLSRWVRPDKGVGKSLDQPDGEARAFLARIRELADSRQRAG
jgi:hypothetical protein